MKNFNKITVFILLVASIMLFASCGKKSGSPEVYLGGKVTEKGDKIIVEGESNLIEGSRVIGKVIVNEDEVLSDTTELVDKKGKFKMELDHHQYGDAEVIILFDFLQSYQEEEIVEHYGEGGEKLEGPYVYLDEHWDVDKVNKKAEVRLPLNADENETKHVFAEQEWGKKPKDYGETRVWFEVDEITEDGEYFYLKGRTNMLEGSNIRAWYSDRSSARDDTRVNPDGTFDFKIEYKYSEDPYFIIKYDPYNSQWETIREAYGYDGEKLVGNLVETSNGSQYLEATIEYEHE
ncbi:hypothetical protein SPD48_01740 [Pseudogracilibacillus sp. SE30717A]|uniref:hypothetical protein n=1 Tax=Pseudogracilibacillus sp. SE30717A TaxID=3098293 RepID=UPI00300DDA71